MENNSYFGASRHKLSAFFSLIFRFSSCHHPLLASALAKIMQDKGNRAVISKDENAIHQLISMISSENRHVVRLVFLNLIIPFYLFIYRDTSSRFILNSYYFWQVVQACFALSSLAADVSIAMQLMKADIMQPIKTVLNSVSQDEVISVLQVVAKLAFTSDTVSQKMLTKDLLKSLKFLCAQTNPEASLNSSVNLHLASLPFRM